MKFWRRNKRINKNKQAERTLIQISPNTFIVNKPATKDQIRTIPVSLKLAQAADIVKTHLN